MTDLLLTLFDSIRDDQIIDTPEQTYDRMSGARDAVAGNPVDYDGVDHRSHYDTGYAEGSRLRDLLAAAGAL